MSQDPKPIIHGIRVDLPALQTIQHKCYPDACRNRPSCCSRFVPHVTQTELERIVGCFPQISRYARSIKNGNGYKNVFEEFDDGTYRIDAKEDESCVFSYARSSGDTLCALHSTALDLQMPPVDLKPRVCSLWPLILSDEPDTELSVDRNWRKFPCNTLSDGGHRLDPGVINIIATCFGVSFLKQLI